MAFPPWFDDVMLMGAFIAVQVVAAVAFFAIRYHFRIFALPGKLLNVQRLLGVCAVGILIGCIMSGWFILRAIQS
jgi:uncharacterized membrane protein